MFTDNGNNRNLGFIPKVSLVLDFIRVHPCSSVAEEKVKNKSVPVSPAAHLLQMSGLFYCCRCVELGRISHFETAVTAGNIIILIIITMFTLRAGWH